MSWKTVLYKYEPAVPNYWLLLLAGFAWTAAGVFLCLRATAWLSLLPNGTAILFAASGVAAAILWYRYMFAGIALRNADRIRRLPERACIFAFSAWRGYGMVAVMMIVGIVLRSSPLPMQYLVFPYFAMGGTLVLSSSVFYRSYWNRKQRANEISQPT